MVLSSRRKIKTNDAYLTTNVCEARPTANICSQSTNIYSLFWKDRLSAISFVQSQGLLSANSLCWWNNALNGATKSLVYKGYVSPGALLVGSEPCALEVLRGAWARRVLQPPAGYQIVGLGELILWYNLRSENNVFKSYT